MLDMTEISFFFTFWTKNFDFLFFDSDHLETYNAPIGQLEAEILSRCHYSETCWPDVVSTELALEKLFHESLFLPLSLSGFVIAIVCIFIGFGQKLYFNLEPIFLAQVAPAWVEDPFNGF